jgi:predicted MFS family arabinose efflux permease
LVNAVGFGWALRVIAFIALAVMLVALAVLKQRPSPQQPRKLIDWSAFHEPRFNVFCVATFFMMAAAYVPYYYIPVFGQEKVGMSQNLSNDMLAVMSTGSIFGRISPGILAVKYGVFPILGLAAFISGMLDFIWGSVTNVGGVVSFSIFYGYFSGACAGLAPVAVQYLSPMHLLGTRSGMALVFMSIGVLIGNPIAGAILNSRSHFTGVQVFGGAFCVFSSLLVFLTSQETQKHEKKLAEAAAERGET